jgi:hypothetical protein
MLTELRQVVFRQIFRVRQRFSHRFPIIGAVNLKLVADGAIPRMNNDRAFIPAVFQLQITRINRPMFIFLKSHITKVPYQNWDIVA